MFWHLDSVNTVLGSESHLRSRFLMFSMKIISTKIALYTIQLRQISTCIAVESHSCFVGKNSFGALASHFWNVLRTTREQPDLAEAELSRGVCRQWPGGCSNASNATRCWLAMCYNSWRNASVQPVPLALKSVRRETRSHQTETYGSTFLGVYMNEDIINLAEWEN